MNAQVDMAKNMVETDFKISPTQTQVGVVLYGNTSQVEINLDEYQDKLTLLEAMSNMKYPELGSNIGAGVQKVKEMLLEAKKEGVLQMLFVFIKNGVIFDQPEVFDPLKESDIELMVVNMKKIVQGKLFWSSGLR